MSIRITNISQSASNKGRRIVICYVKENNGIEDNYKLSSFEIARPEMEEAWAAINVAYQRVHPDYREDETWVDFSFSSVSIKYVKNINGDIVIKEFRLSGVMAWDYMGFSTITTDQISPQQNEELTKIEDNIADIYEKWKMESDRNIAQNNHLYTLYKRLKWTMAAVAGAYIWSVLWFISR